MRRYRRARHWHMGILILIYTCYQVYSQKLNKTTRESSFDGDATATVTSLSFLSPTSSDLDDFIADTTEEPLESTTSADTRHHPFSTWRPKRQNCTPPAIEQFPRFFMGPYARKHGGLIIHLSVAVFTFFGLAIVCGDYFVASVVRICEELKLSPDVAGATFMAAGSSAPELATVIIGVFFVEDDIGISGVIGSAVFNILFVISVCALCSGTVCHLNWWPLVRDCFFYCLSILVMLIIIYNDIISWMEAVVLLLFYFVYCVTLHFDTPLQKWAMSFLPTKEEQSAIDSYNILPDTLYVRGEQEGTSLSQESQQQPVQSTMWENNSTSGAQPATDDWGMNAPNKDHGQSIYECNAEVSDHTEQNTASPQPQVGQLPGHPEYYKSREPKSQEPHNPLEKPVEGGIFAKICWGTAYPIHYMCLRTMLDCRTEKYRNWYPFNFFVSIIWISFYAYFMVWMITIIGSTLGIPDSVMGLTFFSAGVSVPDALSSIAVIKQGYGDMAISNAVGSNVFDILVCLGLPWFIQTAIIAPGSHVNVISKGLTYSTLSLLSTAVFLLVSTHLNGWKLDKRLGIILMIWYISFIALASLYDLNILGELNPPECHSIY